MNARRQAGALERSSFRSRWKDGSVDLFGGLGVLAIGAGWEMGLYWAPAVIAPVLIALWVPLRKAVVEPRLGRVVFRQERRDKGARGTRNTLFLGLLALVAVALFQAVEINSAGGLGPWAARWAAALPCVLLAIPALLTATLTTVSRFVLHAGVLLLTATVATPAGLEPGVQLIIAGAIISVAGLYLFARFLSRSSLPTPEGLD